VNPKIRSAATKRLYEVFARYSSSGQHFCGLCYTPEETERITRTPVLLLDAEDGRTLLWEAADHWENAEVYRHYLPRILDLLGPPWLVEDLFPLHLFETLITLGFRQWPPDEREAILEYLDCLRPDIEHQFSESDQKEWEAGVAALKNPTLALPASQAELENSDDA
jgi:hypothetical protein